MTVPEFHLADLDVTPELFDPLAELKAARNHSPGEVVRVLRKMVANGLDDAGEADARVTVMLARPKVLTATEFDKVIRNARQEMRSASGTNDGGGEGSQATRLVNLANARYDFGITPAGDPFAVPQRGAYVARMLHGGRPPLRPELAKLLFDLEGIAAGGSALSDAIAVLEGQAHQTDPVDLALRVGEHDDGLVLDIGDVTGRVIQITPDGWAPIDRSPVLFRRTAATMPLPDPVGGSSLDETLFALLNVQRGDRPLMKAILAHYLWPEISHVIAQLTGRDGTAKTSATRIMRSLIDPCAAPTKAMPRDEKDWIVAVNAGLIAAVDNVSDISDWLSDAMCRACTGEGLIRRKLYTDSDVSILSARRIVIFNGIDATIKRADFARRVVQFELEPISQIRSDSEVEATWKQIHPHALGALLDLAVSVLKRLPAVVLEGDHRKLTMSDFARIVKTVDPRALDLYTEKLSLLSGDVIDADQFAIRFIRFIDAQPDEQWSGLASELLDLIPKPEPIPRSWPKDPTRFGVWARRFGRVLADAGIELTKEERTKAGQPYTIRRLSLATPARNIGKIATPATQLHHEPVTSGNARSSGVAGEFSATPATPQLHQAQVSDQQECSCVADVADFPTLTADAEGNSSARFAEPWSAEQGPSWPPSETGPCTRCRTPCHRYGEGSNPLCERCRPKPSDVARHIQNRRQQ